MDDEFERAFKKVLDYEGEMKDLDLDEAKEIYYRGFWDKHLYSWIEDERIAIEVFEQAINMGARTANKHLQKAYNLLAEEEIGVDGIIGQRTLDTVNNFEHNSDLFKLLNILQAKKYSDIVKNDESQQKFIRGWLKRVEFNIANKKS